MFSKPASLAYRPPRVCGASSLWQRVQGSGTGMRLCQMCRARRPLVQCYQLRHWSHMMCISLSMNMRDTVFIVNCASKLQYESVFRDMMSVGVGTRRRASLVGCSMCMKRSHLWRFGRLCGRCQFQGLTEYSDQGDSKSMHATASFESEEVNDS